MKSDIEQKTEAKLDKLKDQQKQVQARIKREEQRIKIQQKSREKKLCYQLGRTMLNVAKVENIAHIVSNFKSKDQEWVKANFPDIRDAMEENNDA